MASKFRTAGLSAGFLLLIFLSFLAVYMAIRGPDPDTGPESRPTGPAAPGDGLAGGERPGKPREGAGIGREPAGAEEGHPPSQDPSAGEPAKPDEESFGQVVVSVSLYSHDPDEEERPVAHAAMEAWLGDPASWCTEMPAAPCFAGTTDGEGRVRARLPRMPASQLTAVVRADGIGTCMEDICNRNGILDIEGAPENIVALSKSRSGMACGVLTDGSNRPVPGAPVYAIGKSYTQAFREAFVPGMKVPPLLAKEVTDVEGRYRMPNATAWDLDYFAIGPDGSLVFSRDDSEPEWGEPWERDIHFPPPGKPGSLRVVFRNVNGDLVRGDIEYLAHWDGQRWNELSTVEEIPLEGFLVSALPPGPVHFVARLANGVPETRRILVEPGADTVVTIRENPRERYGLSGKVLRSDGFPVAGALVDLREPVSKKVRTGQDGSFSFDDLVGVRGELVAWASGFLQETFFWKSGGNGMPPAIVTLHSAPEMRGRVAAGAGAETPKIVHLWCLRGSSYNRHEVQIRSDRTFSAIFNSCGGQGPLLEIVAVLPDRHPVKVSAPLPVTGAIDLGEIPFVAGRCIQGRVRGEDEQPIVDASVNVHFERDRVNYEGTRTDKDGRFSIPGMPFWAGSLNVDGSQGYARLFIELPSTETGPFEFTLSRRGQGRLRGTLLDKDGMPHPQNPHVRVYVDAPPDPRCVCDLDTDNRGRFWTRLYVGRYWVKIGDQALTAEPVTILEGADTVISLTWDPD